MIRDESLGIRKGFTRESRKKKIPAVPVTVRLSREPWGVRGGPGGKSEKYHNRSHSAEIGRSAVVMAQSLMLLRPRIHSHIYNLLVSVILLFGRRNPFSALEDKLFSFHDEPFHLKALAFHFWSPLLPYHQWSQFSYAQLVALVRNQHG